MSTPCGKYVIVGAGLAGASAVEGIREHDPSGSILLIGADPDLPYHRPPLSKQLWTGKQQLPDIFVHDAAFYRDRGVELSLGTRIVGIDLTRRELTDNQRRIYGYEKLLLATGGEPRVLGIPGGELPEICYFYNLSDFLRLHAQAAEGRSVLVIGGGFIGSEMAAALNMNGLDVTMLFPDRYICGRVFPESLGQTIQADYVSRGVHILAGDRPMALQRSGDKLVAYTNAGRRVEADFVVAGIGIVPSILLAAGAGLRISDGIEVNEFLRTSDPNVYAAGDNALFPHTVFGPSRVTHWDNAMNQGRCAGRSMAGADEPYTHIPFFFSDLFEFGYEAVGEVDARLQTVADWHEENKTGVIYYLRDERVCGVMMCNVWGKVDAARGLIRSQTHISPGDLHGAILIGAAEPVGAA